MEWFPYPTVDAPTPLIYYYTHEIDDGRSATRSWSLNVSSMPKAKNIASAGTQTQNTTGRAQTLRRIPQQKIF